MQAEYRNYVLQIAYFSLKYVGIVCVSFMYDSVTS